VVDASEFTWDIVLFVVQASAVCADVWVENSTSGVASVAEITEGVDGEVTIASTFDTSPNAGLCSLAGLGKENSTTDV